MAGSTRAITLLLGAAGHLFPFALTCAAPTDDVILVGRPGRLIWYNTYQQRVPPEEVATFSPFAPLVIIRDKSLLGDGLTPCMQVQRNGVSLYILLDQSGTPLEQEGSAGLIYLKAVRLVGDSIVVRSRSGIIVHAADGKTTVTVPPGRTLVRVIEQGERTYVQVPGKFPRFGWVMLGHPGPSTWEERRTERPRGSERLSITPGRLEAFLAGANAALRNIHSLITPREPSPQPPPWITGSISGDTIRCTLHPGARARSYQASLQTLGEAISRNLAVSPSRIAVLDSMLLISLH